MASAAGTQSGRRRQYFNPRKPPRQLTLELAICQVNVNTDFRWPRITAFNLFQYGKNGTSPIVGGNDHGDRYCAVHRTISRILADLTCSTGNQKGAEVVGLNFGYCI